MPEGLSLADGTAVDLDHAGQQFAAAMAAPEPQNGQQPDYPRPRRRKDPEAPFGRNDDGSPVAPHGFGANGKPRQNPPGPGRGGKGHADAKARTQPAGKAVTPAGTAAKADYTRELVEFTDGCWMVMAGTPVPWKKLAGFRTKIRAQAAILKENQAGIVNAVNLGAVHNEQVRAKVEALTTGAISWVLPAMFLLTPFVASTAELWRTKAGDPELAELARQTEADWKTFSAEQIRAMAEASQLAAQAELLAERAAAQAAA